MSPLCLLLESNTEPESQDQQMERGGGDVAAALVASWWRSYGGKQRARKERAGTEMIVSHSFHGSFSLTSFPLNNAAFLFF